jgi:hypothetical protein
MDIADHIRRELIRDWLKHGGPEGDFGLMDEMKRKKLVDGWIDRLSNVELLDWITRAFDDAATAYLDKIRELLEDERSKS